MDPYSLSVEREASKNIEENERECFKDAIVSSRSLNKGFVEPTKLKNAIPEIVSCVLAATFHIAVGLSMAYSAILIPQIEIKNTTAYNGNSTSSINGTITNTTDVYAADGNDVGATVGETSWIASVVVIAAPLGSVIGGFLMETVGRLRTLQIGTIPCVAGWILIATATNVPMILLGRVLSGLSTAMATSPAIVYITEVARPELRGALMSFGPTLASFGMVLVYLKGMFLDWRLVAWLSIIYAVVPVLVVQLFVPESPVWLVSKGKIDEAKKALERLYKSDAQFGKIPAAEQHFTTIMKENEIKLSEARRSKHGGFSTKVRALFLKPTGWKPLFILFLLFLFQQFSGIYITLFYAVTWFQKIDPNWNAYQCSVYVGLTRFFCSMVNTWLLRRYKRRVLCIISSLGMALCMGVSGYYTYVIKEDAIENDPRSIIPVLCLLFYVCASMVGMLTIPWTMTAELFPTDIRGIAQSMSYAMANILMFAAVQSFRSLEAFLGGAYAIQCFFAGVSIGAAVFVWLLLPETHGKKLSEIEEYFHTNFIAAGADAKAKKRRAQRRAQQKAKNQATAPLNAKRPEHV